MKKQIRQNITKIIGLIILIIIGLQYISFQIHEYKFKDYIYNGKIIAKNSIKYRTTYRYFIVNWDNIGIQEINCGSDFDLYNVGDRYSTSLSYVPLIGRIGFAYCPYDPKTQCNIIIMIFNSLITFTLALLMLVYIVLSH